MNSRWVNHSGKDIFLADYTDLDAETLESEAGHVVDVLCKQPHNSVRLIVNASSLVISPREFNLFKQTARKTQPFVQKTAILGITGARQALLDIVVRVSGMQATSFDDIEQAKDWLIQ